MPYLYLWMMSPRMFLSTDLDGLEQALAEDPPQPRRAAPRILRARPGQGHRTRCAPAS